MTKDFVRDLIYNLIKKEMPYYGVKSTQSEIYNQILDMCQRNQNLTIMIDEIDYTFNNERILATIRDIADQSLVTFALIGMERAKEKLMRMNSHYFYRCNAFYEFKPLSVEDSEEIINV